MYAKKNKNYEECALKKIKIMNSCAKLTGKCMIKIEFKIKMSSKNLYQIASKPLFVYIETIT